MGLADGLFVYLIEMGCRLGVLMLIAIDSSLVLAILSIGQQATLRVVGGFY